MKGEKREMRKQESPQRKKIQKQTPIPTTTGQEMFDSRPFVVQQQTPEKSQHTDMNASVMQKERYGHHLERIQSGGAKTSQAVQPKLGAKMINAGVIQLGKSNQSEESSDESAKDDDPKDEDYKEAVKNRRAALKLKIPQKTRREHFERGLSPGRTTYTSPFMGKGTKHKVLPGSPNGREANNGKALEMDHIRDSVDIIPAVDRRAQAEGLSPGSTDARHQQAYAWKENYQLITHAEHVEKGERHTTGQGTKKQEKEAKKLVDEVFKTPLDEKERKSRQMGHAQEGHPYYFSHPNYQANPSHAAHDTTSAIAPRRSSRVKAQVAKINANAKKYETPKKGEKVSAVGPGTPQAPKKGMRVGEHRNNERRDGSPSGVSGLIKKFEAMKTEGTGGEQGTPQAPRIIGTEGQGSRSRDIGQTPAMGGGMRLPRTPSASSSESESSSPLAGYDRRDKGKGKAEEAAGEGKKASESKSTEGSKSEDEQFERDTRTQIGRSLQPEEKSDDEADRWVGSSKGRRR
ncbi:MAG: hypothetical protein V7L00_19455 [Nostoc sp.]